MKQDSTTPWKVTRDRPPERAAKAFVDGTHRACSPEETLERITPHFAAAGITRIADVSGLDRIPISTVIAHRPNARTLAAGSGKGFNKAAATVSAAMEAIELHCAEFSSIEPTAASHAELAADAAIIDVDDLALTRYSLFHPDRTERWVEGWDLIDQQPMWVPLHAARMGGVRMDTGWDAVSFQSGSNGLASGNVMLEAVLAALYEVVERDATTNWTLAERYTLARVPHIDLSTIDDPLPLDLIDRLASANVDLILRDCTIDTDLPTYQATIFDQHGELGLYSGMGTHLDPGIAMVRAITEAVQGRVVYVAGSRDDLFDHRRFMVNRDMGDHRHHTIDDALGGPTISAAVRRPGTAPTFEEDLSTTIDRVRAVGVEHIIVVDLTADDIGVPAVRVIVPGLEGYPFPNYQAGRRGRAFIAKMRELAAEETRAS